MTNQPTDRNPEVNPEQASTNFYWTFGEGEIFNLQTTIRGVLTPEQIDAHLASATAAMKAVVARHGHAKPVGQQAAQAAPAKNGNGGAQASDAAQAAPASNEVLESFAAESLVGSMADGKLYWKVKGGKYSKYGVTIWPEALGSAGFDVERLDPRNVYDLTGKTAVVLIKDGKANKITRLT